MTTIKLRRGTSSQWAAANPVLAAGEPAYATDTNLLKVGDGTSEYMDLPGFLDEPALAASIVDRTKDGIAALRFFEMPDGPSTQIATGALGVQGEFFALSSSNPEKFAIVNGRLDCTASDAAVCYPELELDGDFTRHLWAVVDFDALGSLQDNRSFLLGIPDAPAWGGSSPSGRMGVHAQAYAKIGGVAGKGWQAGPYNVPGAFDPGSKDGPALFAGRRVRFDITLVPETGLVRHYIDGVLTLAYLDPALVGYFSNHALFEFNNTGIHVVEFGAATSVQHGRLLDLPLVDPNPFFTTTALTGSWQKLREFMVYPVSGLVEVTWNPDVTCSGGVYLDLSLATTAPVSNSNKQRICEGALDGVRPSFTQTWVGTPNVPQKIAIWGRYEGNSASIRNNGGEGPRTRDVWYSTANVTI